HIVCRPFFLIPLFQQILSVDCRQTTSGRMTKSIHNLRCAGMNGDANIPAESCSEATLCRSRLSMAAIDEERPRIVGSRFLQYRRSNRVEFEILPRTGD